MKVLIALSIILLVTNCAVSQPNDVPYECGFYCKDFNELKDTYKSIWENLRVKKNERVASVGSGNGYVEAQVSCFIDNIIWTLQDIDTVCLNRQELNKVIAYHEKLIGKTLRAKFEIVIGEQDKTNLQKKYYDKILLVNVFHELKKRELIVKDIGSAIKRNGLLIVMERMATAKNQRHDDCNFPKLLETDFLTEMKVLGFILIHKKLRPKSGLTFYTFKYPH